MEVGIQSLIAHLRHLLHIVTHHMFQKLLQTALGIHLLQLEIAKAKVSKEQWADFCKLPQIKVKGDTYHLWL